MVRVVLVASVKAMRGTAGPVVGVVTAVTVAVAPAVEVAPVTVFTWQRDLPPR